MVHLNNWGGSRKYGGLALQLLLGLHRGHSNLIPLHTVSTNNIISFILKYMNNILTPAMGTGGYSILTLAMGTGVIVFCCVCYRSVCGQDNSSC